MPERKASMFNIGVGVVETPELTSSQSNPDLGSGEGARRIKSKLYTRTGDHGSSTLCNGRRRPKNDEFFEALGVVEELNSALGIANFYCVKADNGLSEQITKVQFALVEMSNHISTPKSSSTEKQIEERKFDESHVDQIEEMIDHIDAKTSPLKTLILPSGGECAVFLHHTRSICRRLERRVVTLSDEVDISVIKYTNRLGDFLFACTRFAAQHEGAQVLEYRKCADSGKK